MRPRVGLICRSRCPTRIGRGSRARAERCAPSLETSAPQGFGGGASCCSGGRSRKSPTCWRRGPVATTRTRRAESTGRRRPTLHAGRPPHNMRVEIERLSRLRPEQLAPLIAESQAHGLTFVRRLADEWAGGVNRFDHPGEALFVARAPAGVVAIGGLN